MLLFFLLVTANFSLRAQSWYWAKTAGGIQSDKATDMDIDTAGNLYVVGYYNYNATFGPYVAPATFGKDGYLAKLDTAGNFLWLRTADGGWDERVLGMCTDPFGNIYVTGTCWYNTNFGSCPTTNGWGSSDEIFVAKFNVSGTCQWLVQAGGDADDHGYDLVISTSRVLFLTNTRRAHWLISTTFLFLSLLVILSLLWRRWSPLQAYFNGSEPFLQ
jgi:hypothetical protein